MSVSSETGAAKRTIVEEGTEFHGTLSSSCPIVVRGTIEGDVSGPSVEVTVTGVLAGKAKLTSLRSQGEIAGQFEAETMELSGRVRQGTTLRAQSLEVSLAGEEGPRTLTFGACALEIGEEPRKEQAIADAIAGAKPPAEKPTAAPADEGAAAVVSTPDAVAASSVSAEAPEREGGSQGKRGKRAAEKQAIESA